jgi:RNA polymerase sigma factor (sigma-70 family)
MTAAHGPQLLRQIRRLVADNRAGLPDGDLLRGYLDRRDEAAFAALVERHGPMVLGVCRAVLGNRHDAEDAFQAAFLVLARKAGHIRGRDSVGGWLHAVAYRLALRARAAAARREAVEANAARAAVASADDLTWGEVRTILHAELAALPQRYREPLVLCHLQGLTQDEAANRLGWTAATLKGRLQRGREVLRSRLERRGLGLSAALGALGLADHAFSTPVPEPLAEAASRSAFAPANAAVAALARESLTPPVRLWALAVMVLVGSLTAGFAFCPRRSAELVAQAVVGEPVAVAAVPGGNDLHGDPLPDGAVARLGTARLNHGYGLNALYFLGDGKTILSEGDGFLRYWDIATGKELRHQTTSKTSFDDQTVLSPDGKTLTSLNQEIFTSDHTDVVRFYDLSLGKQTRMVPLPVSRVGLDMRHRNALTPDGRLCAVHGWKNIHVFDTATAKELWKLPEGGDDIRALAFAGNDLLLTADRKQVIHLWEARTGIRVRKIDHGAPAETLAASADGRSLAILESNRNRGLDLRQDGGHVYVWDLATGTRTHKLTAGPKRWCTSVRFAPDGKVLIACYYSTEGDGAMVWDMATGRRLHDFKVPEWAGMPHDESIAYSLGGKYLAIGRKSKFHLWDLESGRRLSSDITRHAQVQAVFFAPDADRLMTASNFTGTLSAWDATSGRLLHTAKLPPELPFAPIRPPSPGGRHVLLFGRDAKKRQHVVVWDVQEGRPLQTLTTASEYSSFIAALSPDASSVATAFIAYPGGGQREKEAIVQVWDVRTGREIWSLKDRKETNPRELSVSADGKTLFVAGQRVTAHDLASGEERSSWKLEPRASAVKSGFVTSTGDRGEFEPRAWKALAVSPQGKFVACVLDPGFDSTPLKDRLALFDAKTGAILRRWDDSGKRSRSWEQLAFSPDGRFLTSSDGDLVHLWEVATGKPVRTFRGHRGEVQALAVSGNGRRLASAGADLTILLWDLAFPLKGLAKADVAGERELAGWWDDLANPDARRGYAAVWRLAGAPAASVPFLRQRLKPATDAQVREIRRSLADLESGTLAKRSEAAKRLRGLGLAALAPLLSALTKNPSLESRRRIEQVLDDLRSRPASGEALRQTRAVAALEHAGTPEAGRIVRELAAGAAGAWLTEEAQAACARLERRPAP